MNSILNKEEPPACKNTSKFKDHLMLKESHDMFNQMECFKLSQY